MGILWSKSDQDTSSWWDRINAYPLDLWLLINESRLAIDWDELSLVLALPVGMALNVFSIVITLFVANYKLVLSQTRNVLFQTDYRHYEKLKNDVVHNSFRSGPRSTMSSSSLSSSSYSGSYESRNGSGADSIVRFLSNINIAIIALSLLNVYYMMVSTRFYNLMYNNREPNTPSARRFTLVNNYSLGQMLWDTMKAKVSNMIPGKKASSPVTSNPGLADDPAENDVIYKEIWQLQIWQPSKFNLHLFMSLNPLLNLLNIMLLELSFVKLLATNLAVTGTLYFLISKFLVLLQDKQIVYQEMFLEYQEKFVTPRTTTLKKDVAIDATRGPYYSTILTDVVPFLANKLRVFTTHDIEGNEVKNYHELKPRNPPPVTTTRQNYHGMPPLLLHLHYSRTTTSPYRRGPPSTQSYYTGSNDSYKFKLEINQLKKLNNELSRQLQLFRSSSSTSSSSHPVQTNMMGTIGTPIVDGVDDDSDHSEEELPWYVPSTPKNDHLFHEGNTVIPPPSNIHRTPSPFKMPDRTPSPSKLLRMSLPTRLPPNLSQSSSRIGSPSPSTAAERLNQFVRRSLIARTPELAQRSNRSSPNRSPSPQKPLWQR